MKPIGLLIHHLHLIQRQMLNQVFEELDLTSSQAFTLIHVIKSHRKNLLICQKDIEKAMEISNPTVTGILNRLEQKELIQRVPGKKDARIRNIIVTQKALELDKILQKKFQEVEKSLVSSLDDEQQHIFHEMLQKIIDSHGENTKISDCSKGDDCDD